jgi:dTDP-4-amino-4,6-dideoxygalactose transaminase
VGGVPILVEITEDLVIDLDDLATKATSSGARYLLLSNMRGHLCDMDRLMAIAATLNLTVIEDCAHTMGAAWNGRWSGNFGLSGCFSTQTYKHLNSGEGGVLTSHDPEFMARAIMLSGSYMLFERHGAAPPAEVFAEIRYQTPNMSARMDNLRAALLRPQLAGIAGSIAAWNARHDRLAATLLLIPGIAMADRPASETYVGSSIQFRLPGIALGAARGLVAGLAAVGVEVKWFGSAEPVGFTSAHQSWRFVAPQNMPQTDAILAGLFDMRLPLTFTLDDCDLIAAHIGDAVLALRLEGKL